MVVLFVLYLVLANWPASGSGSRVKLEGSTPALSSCEKLIQDLLDKYDDRSPYSDEPGTSGFIDCPDQTDPLQTSLLGPEAAAVRGRGGQGAQLRPKSPVSFDMSVMSTKPSGASGATS